MFSVVLDTKTKGQSRKMVDGRDQNDHPCNRENIIDRAGKFAQRREKGFQQFIKMQPRIRLLAMFVPVMQCIAGL